MSFYNSNVELSILSALSMRVKTRYRVSNITNSSKTQLFYYYLTKNKGCFFFLTSYGFTNTLRHSACARVASERALLTDVPCVIRNFNSDQNHRLNEQRRVPTPLFKTSFLNRYNTGRKVVYVFLKVFERN